MQSIILLASLLLAAHVSAEVCVENDTNIPENSFFYGFIPADQLDLKNSPHPTLSLPSDFHFNRLGEREGECIGFSESTMKGNPGYLLIYLKPPATSAAAYASEDIAYVSYDLAVAPASSTLMLPVEIRQGYVPTIKSKMDNGPFTKFGMRKVLLITSTK